MRCSILLWTLFIDLDKTVWDHFDASILYRPFKLYNRNCIIDSHGEKLCLYEGARAFLDFCKRNNFIISSLSWNRYSVTKEIMDLLGITKYFDYLFNKLCPLKNETLIQAIEIIKKNYALECYPKIIYIDDQRKYYDLIKNTLKEIYFIHIWIDIGSYEELIKYVKSLVN
ncbi:MAG: magnesium-dependent phosphatase-1 [Thermoprotei archaeon]|nr:MAG: magnesium-dependent phosphatase-1 [Thermoprotei archaeon]